jgi:hypothetical protein
VPPEVWAAFLCIKSALVARNFCYQAFTLVDPMMSEIGMFRQLTKGISAVMTAAVLPQTKWRSLPNFPWSNGRTRSK